MKLVKKLRNCKRGTPRIVGVRGNTNKLFRTVKTAAAGTSDELKPTVFSPGRMDPDCGHAR